MTRTFFCFFHTSRFICNNKKTDRRTDGSQTNFNVEQVVQMSSFNVQSRCYNLSKTHVRIPPTPKKSYFACYIEIERVFILMFISLVESFMFFRFSFAVCFL